VSAQARKSASRAAPVPADRARRQIIEATTRLLQVRRFRDLSVDDVMSEAGLSRTVFYRHFNGLTDIVLGLVEDLLGEIVAEAEAGDPRDRQIMRRQLALVVETFRVHGRLLLAFDEAAHYHEDVEQARRAMYERSIEVTGALIERGIAEGNTPPLPVHDVAWALTAMNSRYLLDLLASDQEFDADAALETLWTIWTRTTWPDPLARP
jgi:TetR/AcrR family transcriptional regulator, ethionamide resistance regulator